jgi:hypothetical protein
MNGYYIPINDKYCTLDKPLIRLTMWPLIKFLHTKKKIKFNQQAYQLLDSILDQHPLYLNHKQVYDYRIHNVFSYKKTKNKTSKTQITIPIHELQANIGLTDDMFKAYDVLLAEFKTHKATLNNTLMPELEHVIAFKGYYWLDRLTYLQWLNLEDSVRLNAFKEDYSNPLKAIIDDWKILVDDKYLPIHVEQVLADINQTVFNYAIYCEIEDKNDKKCGFLGEEINSTVLFTLAEARLFQTESEARQVIEKNTKNIFTHCALVQIKPSVEKTIEIFGTPTYFNSYMEKERLNFIIHDTNKTNQLSLATQLLDLTKDTQLKLALEVFIKGNLLNPEKLLKEDKKTKI